MWFFFLGGGLVLLVNWPKKINRQPFFFLSLDYRSSSNSMPFSPCCFFGRRLTDQTLRFLCPCFFGLVWFGDWSWRAHPVTIPFRYLTHEVYFFSPTILARGDYTAVISSREYQRRTGLELFWYVCFKRRNISHLGTSVSRETTHLPSWHGCIRQIRRLYIA